MKSSKLDPLVVTSRFLATHEGVTDIRLHFLLWFNAFEYTMRFILAWRLGCSEDVIPRQSSGALFELALVGHRDLYSRVKSFLEARNLVAHHFHESSYEDHVKAFSEQALGEAWPDSDTAKLESLSRAVRHLAIDIACAVDQTPARGEFPFPQLLFELGE